ncbi:hypothetical protein M2459_000023 [Parabacteroides sp. PF5-5]|uniref:IPT/TIG domain-containing protein n=1 Tax=unclassified Parabacteroides TaxID=2649774 RepID=UPI00247300BC|nr:MULTISPECIES: IPT/TIG domain-containing protein [unclassified Parabacteroides]MDH6303691.1 hypothetical protein [Parabacteroides sp. PH5-39]MDH6314308.1 hypothetical protein [Parabacteroides sp. PF5-13]MDH6318628.1 hypothetical protein [Parabacteroides sp. PH5-13]MDH6322080.1 hypothetical protein [Parabacteroides sp. PH5-8]MDH6325841.1 hypothetical protein [Parabacteroides sp. PH5-41]
MESKEHLFKYICSLRLWLFTALLIVSHGFIQAQQIVITYDNPNSAPGASSSGNSEPSAAYAFSAQIPVSANAVTGKAYGGGGGGGSRGSGSVYHAGGGGGGGYIEKIFGNITGFAFGQVGAGGKRGELNGLSGGPGSPGSPSHISFGGITITANAGTAGTNNGNGQGGGTSVTDGTADYSQSGTNGQNYGSGNGGAGGNSGGYPDYGGGAGGGYPTEASSGYNGYNPGGGGGGGRANIITPSPGGHGGGGRVILSYTISELTVSSSETRCQGSNITLTASYGTEMNITMQWYKDGALIPGATETTYTIFDAQVADNGSYTVKATYNIDYSSATKVTGSSLPSGLSVSGTSLVGTVTSSPYNLTISPIPVISSSSYIACSGENINYTPSSAMNIIPVGTTYSWKVNSVTGTINPAPSDGSGSSINLGAFTNNTAGNTTVVYDVTPKTTAGCEGTPFTFTVIVTNVPTILSTQSTVCSGDTLHLWLNNPVGGTYSTSDESIAYVNPTTGVLHTDVELINGIPTLRPSHSVNEGKGGTVTITFTTSGGCTTKKVITVKPRVKTPRTRWDFNSICPVDEETVAHTKQDSLNIATPLNPGGVYFANHIVWDSLVINSGNKNIDLSQIMWYADAAKTTFIRQGGTASPAVGSGGQMANFWQNKAHTSETYWATITHPDSCESRPIRVTVHIYDNPEQIGITDLIGYVQPSGTSHLDLSDYLNLNLDESEQLLWYTQADTAATNRIEEPPALDPTQPINITYWVVKSDVYGCRSLATPFRIWLVPMPKITIKPDTLVCPGESVNIRVNITDGTAPYNFKISNMATGAVDSKINWNDDTYSFATNSLVSVTRRITEFTDAHSLRVTYEPYGLRVPETGYFSQNTLSVVVTEITSISPASGPTTGGTYTGNPDTPVNPNGTVTISGSGFKPFDDSIVSLITFDGTPATNITVINDDTITCTPPAHVSGYVTVSVTAGCGTTSFTNGYYYEPINISVLEPAYAPVTGGTRITIRGTGLLAASKDWTSVEVTLAGVPATVESANNTVIVCITGPSDYSLLDTIIINNGSEIRKFPERFTYYPVEFIENGKWSEPQRWKTHTADHILPYPGARVHIKANCLQDITVDMDSITVHPSKAYTLNNNTILEANVFTLKENASFLNNHPNNGNMQAVQQNVEHILAKGRNWYVSSPVKSNVTTPTYIYPTLGKDVSGNDLTGWRMESYNEAQHAWVREDKNNPFVSGLGYTAYSENANIAVKFSGEYTDGDQTTPFNVTRQNDEHAKSGFNLVGNPFPSYWHWTSEIAQQSNLYSTIWYRTWVGGVYEFWSYNASGDVAVAPSWIDATPTGSYSLGYIPPMQGFWVRLKEGATSGILTFSNTGRTHSDHASNMLKSAAEENNTESRPLLRLVAGNDKRLDETVIYAEREATTGFDTYDSDKWFVDQGVEIFTLPDSSTRGLVINGLPEIVDKTEIPLGFQADEDGIFNFHAKEILNLDSLDVFLYDKWRKEECNLRDGDYNFTASSTLITDRFSIIFRTANATDIESVPEIDTKTDGNMLIYANKSGQMIVLLQLPGEEERKVNVSVFDIMGRKLAEQPVIVGQRTTLSGTFLKGIYVARAGKLAGKIMVGR